MLLNNFNDIFVSENKFDRTDIIQHQIKTGDTMPIKQKLNGVTREDSYPTSQIQELFDAFGRNKWFSILELDSGYWQVAKI
ncbi:hypothetical protein G9A89_021197 [Geosiphon pyriformis]|nr:hypothetical protein G9A89_021197 [Geosiphon pyriformis]